MERQARRGSRRHGRPFGAGSSAAGAGRAAGTGSRTVIKAQGPTGSALSAPQTRATYRLLLLKGLAPDEAANLTAFLCGIHIGSQRWRLAEINRLLFLRELSEGGRFGSQDGSDNTTASS